MTHRPGREADEAGAAVVEVALLGSVLLGLLAHAVVAVGQAQRLALASSLAAREGGRRAVLAADPAEARAEVEAVVAQVARHHGLEPDALRPEVSGSLARGGWVTVTVSGALTLVRLPLLGRAGAVRLPVEERWVGPVDAYRSLDEGAGRT